MMPEHAKTVEDVPGTLGLLQEIYDTAEVRAAGKPWFVLLEKQPLDAASWKKGLIFNTQLEFVCNTFFTMKGKEVRGPGNAFAERHHDRSQWESTSHMTDMADNLAQCLFYFYRNKGNLLEGKVVSATPQQQASEPESPAPAPRRKVTTDKPPRATEVQAARERLLTDLEIKQYDRVKALKTSAGRLFAVHKHSPEHTREFLLLPDKYNRKGIAVNSEQHLADRLAHLKQR